MADYFTRFSCLLDVGTVENAARALDIYNDLMAQNAAEDPPAEPFLLSIEPEHGATRLWMRDPGTADPQLLITFVTRCAETLASPDAGDSNGRASPPSRASMASPEVPMSST